MLKQVTQLSHAAFAGRPRCMVGARQRALFILGSLEST